VKVKRGICKDCGDFLRLYPRGLCKTCYYTPSVRERAFERATAVVARVDARGVRQAPRPRGREESVREIAAELDRTKSQVNNKTHALRLARFRSPKDRHERVRELLYTTPQPTDQQIADKLGCSRASVQRHRLALRVPGRTKRECSELAIEAKRKRLAERPNAPTPAEARILALLADGPLSTNEI
jgi:hypothetical protein